MAVTAVDGYAENKSKGDKLYHKYKETGNEKFKVKAKRYYNYSDGYKMQLEHPATNVNIKKTEINDSFKSSKKTVFGINEPKTTFKKTK